MYAGSHDKDTLMAASIAELLFPAGQHQAEGEPYQAYVARIKTLYHKQVLVPLRRCLDVPEVRPPPLLPTLCSVTCRALLSILLVVCNGMVCTCCIFNIQRLRTVLPWCLQSSCITTMQACVDSKDSKQLRAVSCPHAALPSCFSSNHSQLCLFVHNAQWC